MEFLFVEVKRLINELFEELERLNEVLSLVPIEYWLHFECRVLIPRTLKDQGPRICNGSQTIDAVLLKLSALLKTLTHIISRRL